LQSTQRIPLTMLLQETPPNCDSGDYSSDVKPAGSLSCPPGLADEEGGKKKIKWKKGKPVASANTNTKEMNTSDTSKSIARSVTPPPVIRERDDSSPSFLRKLIAFLFSPMGVVTIFVIVNYPWLKHYVGISSGTNNATVSPDPWLKQYVGILSGTSNATVSPDDMQKPAPVPEPTLENPSKTANELSPNECKNPLKKLFDRNCRLEVRKQRQEKKLVEMRKKRKKQQERLKRRQAPPVYGNETLVKNTNDDTPFLNLECSNILSRECRQKKRLMAQMAAIAKGDTMK
jgi:hypothetical protein